MVRKVLTPEMAKKARYIHISKTYNVILLDMPVKKGKVYGVLFETKKYKMTPENLKVAYRYKKIKGVPFDE